MNPADWLEIGHLMIGIGALVVTLYVSLQISKAKLEIKGDLSSIGARIDIHIAEDRIIHEMVNHRLNHLEGEK